LRFEPADTAVNGQFNGAESRATPGSLLAAAILAGAPRRARGNATTCAPATNPSKMIVASALVRGRWNFLVRLTAQASSSSRPLLSDSAAEPSEPHNEQKETYVMQTKPPTKHPSHSHTQQTSCNTNEKTVNDTGLLGSPRNDEGHNQRQKHLKPWHQPGTDPLGKVVDGILVGSASGLKSQDKRIDGNNADQDKEAQRDNCNGSAENTKPSDTR
jgi:hypothetical protein